MKKKDSKNNLDFIPEKNPEIEYETGEDGIITVLIEWKGFYHKLAQRFFRRPRVSEIKLDKLGTFVWNSIDDKKDVHAISKELEAEFPSMEQPLTRLIKYLEILHDNHLIYWKGEKRKWSILHLPVRRSEVHCCLRLQQGCPVCGTLQT